MVEHETLKPIHIELLCIANVVNGFSTKKIMNISTQFNITTTNVLLKRNSLKSLNLDLVLVTYVCV